MTPIKLDWKYKVVPVKDSVEGPPSGQGTQGHLGASELDVELYAPPEALSFNVGMLSFVSY